PATISFLAAPNFLCSAISRIASTDSFCAGSMKLQVLTTRTSASSARGVSWYPSPARMPIITSLSTRFFGHPRLTNPTLVICDDLVRRIYVALQFPSVTRRFAQLFARWLGRANLIKQMTEAYGIAGRAAEARLCVNLGEFTYLGTERGLRQRARE